MRLLPALRKERDPAADQSFVVGAVIIGLAGAFYAQQLRFIEPTNAFDPTKLTFLVWVMLIMGGSGNNRGAVLGGLMLWVIWSGTGLVIRFGANVLAMFSRFVAQCTGRKAVFAPVPDRADTSVRLAEIPKGILPEVRPAALGGKTSKCGTNVFGGNAHEKTLLVSAAALAFASVASAQVKVGNPMAVTGPIPDLVAPMVDAVNLAVAHVNEQGGVLGQEYVMVAADLAGSGCCRRRRHQAGER